MYVETIICELKKIFMNHTLLNLSTYNYHHITLQNERQMILTTFHQRVRHLAKHLSWKI